MSPRQRHAPLLRSVMAMGSISITQAGSFRSPPFVQRLLYVLRPVYRRAQVAELGCYSHQQRGVFWWHRWKIEYLSYDPGLRNPMYPGVAQKAAGTGPVLPFMWHRMIMAHTERMGARVESFSASVRSRHGSSGKGPAGT